MKIENIGKRLTDDSGSVLEFRATKDGVELCDEQGDFIFCIKDLNQSLKFNEALEVCIDELKK